MHAVAERRMGEPYTAMAARYRLAVAMMSCTAACSAFALGEDIATGTRAKSMSHEVSALSLPRFDNIDGTSRSSRINMTWLAPRRSSLGLSVGMSNIDGLGMTTPAPMGSVGPSVDLGFHWRHTLDSNYRLDITAWRRMGPTDAVTLVQSRQPTYGARVEMQISSLPSSGLVADRGFLGLQLESGARITVKRSGGKPMLYYRTKF